MTKLHVTKIRWVFGEITQDMPAGIYMSAPYESSYDERRARQQLAFCGPTRDHNRSQLRTHVRVADVRWPPKEEDAWHSAYVQLQAGDMPQAMFHINDARDGAQAAELVIEPRRGASIILCGHPAFYGRIALDVTLTIEPRKLTLKEERQETHRAHARYSVDMASDKAAAHALHSVIWSARIEGASYQDFPFLLYRDCETILSAEERALAVKANGWWYWDEHGFGIFRRLDLWSEDFDAWEAKRRGRLLLTAG